MTDRQAGQQVKSEGVQRTLKDTNPIAAPIKLYLVGEERRSGTCFTKHSNNIIFLLYCNICVNIPLVILCYYVIS